MTEAVKKEPFYMKWWFWVLILIILAGIAGAVQEPSATTESSAPETPAAPQTDQAPNTSEPVQPEETTLEDKVRSIVVEAVKEKTNMDKERIVDIQINDHMGVDRDGAKIALITLNANDNFTANMAKGMMLMQSSDLFQPLFDLPEIEEVALFWQSTLVDAYGNEKDDTVLKVTLTREIAEKINWGNFDRNNYEKVASIYWEHPAFRQ